MWRIFPSSFSSASAPIDSAIGILGSGRWNWDRSIRSSRSNGQVIATSEAYERRQAALNGIEAVKKNAPHAEIAGQDGE